MRPTYKWLITFLVAINVLIYFIYSGDVSAPDAPVAIGAGAAPTDGLVGETTAAAADRAKQELYTQDENPHAIAVTDGALPPPPAQQLVPITQGGGDMVGSQPPPAVAVPYEGSGTHSVPLATLPVPAPAGQ